MPPLAAQLLRAPRAVTGQRALPWETKGLGPGLRFFTASRAHAAKSNKNKSKAPTAKATPPSSSPPSASSARSGPASRFSPASLPASAVSGAPASTSSPSSPSSSPSSASASASSASASSSASSSAPPPPPRAPRRKTYIYGGELPPAAKAQQATKQYPHMFPAEGTRMHWFLTSRGVHVAITMSVLSLLASLVFVLEFRRKTPYLDLLPSWSFFVNHPLAATHQVFTVYTQHVAWTSEQTALAREKNLEDARKRKAFRVAHGLEKAEHGLQGGVQGVEVRFGEKVGVAEVEAELSADEARNLQEEEDFEAKVKEAYRASIVKAGGDPEVMERAREGVGKPREIKKWLGIW